MQSEELPIVASIGFFDGVHLGHKYLIEQIKKIAAENDCESAVITFTEHPQKVLESSFSPYLLTTSKEKMELLKKTGLDYCIPLPFTKELASYSAYKFMDEILKKLYNTHTLIIGYDHRFGSNRSEGFEEYVEYGKQLGINVIQIDEYADTYVSSSKIRKFLADGKIESANKLLGYNYRITGKVVHGLNMANTLGYPTANIQLEEKDKDKMIPLCGVYVARIFVDNKAYNGMLYIGRRPTMLNNGGVTIEANIFDFEGDLYDKIISVELLKFVRADTKFENQALIKLQIDKDYKEIKEYFTQNKNNKK